MARSLHEHLRALADAIEADEKADRDAALAEKVEKMETVAEGERLSPEDRALLDWARGLKERLEAEDAEDEAADEVAKKRAEKKTEEKPAEEKPRARRPGRKSGQAYSWYTDADGNVIQVTDGMARVYSGPDEDDEVELPEAAES